jgi:hypothetical protein
MKLFIRHSQHYVPLITILAAGILGFSLFTYDRLFQSVLLVAVAASYVVWGVVHHFIHDDLNYLVIIEYTVIAVLGVILGLTLIYRA